MNNFHTYPRLMEVIAGRFSCRAYNPEAVVDPDLVRAVVEAAQLAPSACNRQPWTFVAVTDPAVRATLLAKSRPGFLDAPVVLVACGMHSQAWHRPSDGKDHTDVDVSIAVEHLCLAATALGLATCWVCSFDVDATRAALALPDDVEPVALLPLGYPAADTVVPLKKRKSQDEILKWEKF